MKNEEYCQKKKRWQVTSLYPKSQITACFCAKHDMIYCITPHFSLLCTKSVAQRSFFSYVRWFILINLLRVYKQTKEHQIRKESLEPWWLQKKKKFKTWIYCSSIHWKVPLPFRKSYSFHEIQRSSSLDLKHFPSGHASFIILVIVVGHIYLQPPYRSKNKLIWQGSWNNKNNYI